MTPLHPGTVVGGDFELVRPLGEGGMSVVWLARDIALGRDVALKLMTPPEGASAESMRRRLRREAHILAVAEHPSILPVYRRGEDEATGLSFYAMKACLVSGAEMRRLCADVFGCALPRHPERWDAAPRALSLADLLEGGKALPQGAVARFGEDLAEAVAAAHAMSPPVVHRDIKPSNVLFDHDGRAMLADFGIASRLHDDPSDRSVDTFDDTTSTHGRRGFVGTADYAAPEQRQGDPASPAMDWWSLGAVLFEALTGERPRGLEVPSEFDPKRISRRWDPLLKGMLATRPERRTADPGAIIAALRSLQSSRRERTLQWGLAALHAFGGLLFFLAMLFWLLVKLKSGGA